MSITNSVIPKANFQHQHWTIAWRSLVDKSEKSAIQNQKNELFLKRETSFCIMTNSCMLLYDATYYFYLFY